MNDQTTDVRPEVSTFVDQVRALMADLDPEEQQELTAGLDADLSELVAEHGPEALGDPADYAGELRTAAGHAPTMGRAPRERRLRTAVMDAIDAAHAHWDRLLDALPGDLRGFLTALQPAWWLVRAFVAWMVVQDVRGPYVVLSAPWLLVLAVFVVVSVQLGRRQWGVGRLLRGSVLARLVLVALNVLAVCLLPGAVDRMVDHVASERAWMYSSWQQTVPADVHPSVVTYRGRQVCELRVFDADGKRVSGGYVVDVPTGRRLPMTSRNC